MASERSGLPLVMAALIAGVQRDEQRVRAFVGQLREQDLRAAVEALAVGAGFMVRDCVGAEVGVDEVSEYARANAVWLLTSGELDGGGER